MASEPKRKGGRRRVEFIKHPQTGKPVDGLSELGASGRFHRTADHGVSRVCCKRQRLQGIADVRRAVFEHRC